MKSAGSRALLRLPDGRTLLRRQIDLVRQVFGSPEIVVVVGHEADKVVKSLPDGIRVVENEFYDETGAARSVAMGMRATSAQSCLVVYGDLVFNRETLADVPKDRSVVILDSKGRIPHPDVGVNVDEGLVVHFDYGLQPRWTQIAMLRGRELALFKAFGVSSVRRRHLGFEVLNDVINAGGELVAFENPDMEIAEVDSQADVKKLNGVVA